MIGTRISGLWRIVLIVIVGCSLWGAELSLAGGPPVQWQKTFGGMYSETGYSVRQTSDGEYIIAGYTNSFGEGLTDVYLIKTEPNGTMQWQKTFGGYNYDVGCSVKQTSDGEYIIAGYTMSFGAGDYDVYLIKTEPNGTKQWEKTFGGSNYDVGRSVQQTADGGYIIGGTTESFGAGNRDVYLIKTDSNGNSQWQKTFGGSDDDIGYSVVQTADGGYVIAGWTSSFGEGLTDVYLIKTEPNGTIQWQKTFGGSELERGVSVRETNDNGFIIAGTTMGNAYLIKTDSDGNDLWQKTFEKWGLDSGKSVQQTSDGGYIISGTSWSYHVWGYDNDVYVIRTNSDGNCLWQRSFGGWREEGSSSIQQSIDRGYIIAGGVGGDVYLIKLCAEGTLSGDLNCDGTVNFKDVEILISQWLQPRSMLYSPADIYGVGDGIVDFFDFSTQAEDLGKSSLP